MTSNRVAVAVCVPTLITVFLEKLMYIREKKKELTHIRVSNPTGAFKMVPGDFASDHSA